MEAQKALRKLQTEAAPVRMLGSSRKELKGAKKEQRGKFLFLF